MPERDIAHDLKLAVSETPNIRIWRNNVGAARTIDGRKITFGLAPGSADFIGVRRLTITADMVGKTIGQAVAIETKSRRGRVRKNQRDWLEIWRGLGGLGIVCRDLKSTMEILLGKR